MTYFAYPHAGAWAVVYVVPGTGVLSVWMVCRTLPAARQACEDLNDSTVPARFTGYRPCRPGVMPSRGGSCHQRKETND